MQLPWIMLGHSNRAFTKLLALGTRRQQDEQYRSIGATGLQSAKSRGKVKTWADHYCTSFQEELFPGKYIPHAASAQQTI